MNRLPRYTTPLVLLGLAAACLLPTGCASYRVGSALHPQINSLAVGAVTNSTREPGLGIVLRRKLTEELTVDGSASLTTTDRADAVVNTRIVSCVARTIAATSKRDDAARDRDRDTYQAAIHRAEVRVEFDAVMPGRAGPVVSSQQVRGTADFSHLPDLHVARDDAFEQALNDAARKIVAALTEAW